MTEKQQNSCHLPSPRKQRCQHALSTGEKKNIFPKRSCSLQSFEAALYRLTLCLSVFTGRGDSHQNSTQKGFSVVTLGGLIYHFCGADRCGQMCKWERIDFRWEREGGWKWLLSFLYFKRSTRKRTEKLEPICLFFLLRKVVWRFFLSEQEKREIYFPSEGAWIIEQCASWEWVLDRFGSVGMLAINKEKKNAFFKK